MECVCEKRITMPLTGERTFGRDVQTQAQDMVLESGSKLRNDVVRGRLYGPENAPLIIIPGGISASRFVADGADGQSGSGGWWCEIVRPGGPVDLDRFQVLGVDLAPNADQSRARLTITTRDQAHRLARLLEHIGVGRAHSLIGMSYGGMVAMQFASLYPDRLRRLCIFGAAHRPWPFAVGLRGIGRRIIEDMSRLGDAAGGLKLARELAMTTYRSPEEFSTRFTAAPDDNTPPHFDVGDYLEARGRAYPDIMPVNRFLALSESIDLHRIDPAEISCPTTLIAVSSDQLAPVSEMQAFEQALGGPADLHVFDSIYGHDSFLKSTEHLAPLLQAFCTQGQGDAKEAGHAA